MIRRFLVLPAAVALAATCLYAQKPQWELSSLPQYQPEQKVSGVIRNWGRNIGAGVMKLWQDGFVKYQPDIRFEEVPHSGSSDAAIGGLWSGSADMAPNGREVMFSEYLGFYETFGYDPLEMTVATGAYDGATWGVVIFVNKDNPISKLTMKQLDGIFGSERTGGYIGGGFKWFPQAARSAKENIRTWGQLGLTGEWANKEINTYGYAFTGMTNFFQRKVFNGGDKWNPNYRQYVETGTKMVVDESLTITHALAELEKDRYGICWAGIPQLNKARVKVKSLALAAKDGGPYIEPTIYTFQDRTYPLTRSLYILLNRPPGKPLDPKLKEFMRYILSREGQEDVVKKSEGEKGAVLPLTVDVVREQRQKLE